VGLQRLREGVGRRRRRDFEEELASGLRRSEATTAGRTLGKSRDHEETDGHGVVLVLGGW
jgi:hypothetical protein